MEELLLSHHFTTVGPGAIAFLVGNSARAVAFIFLGGKWPSGKCFELSADKEPELVFAERKNRVSPGERESNKY